REGDVDLSLERRNVRLLDPSEGGSGSAVSLDARRGPLFDLVRDRGVSRYVHQYPAIDLDGIGDRGSRREVELIRHVTRDAHGARHIEPPIQGNPHGDTVDAESRLIGG